MTKYRNNLPQISDEIFLTDGGLETTLVFHNGIDLPEFSAFVLMKDSEGRNTLKQYYKKYISIAKQHGLSFILETPTWRASSKWGQKLGYTEEELADINHKSVELLLQIRDEHETDSSKLILSGSIGPKGDGYIIDEMMTIEAAKNYHTQQIRTFSNTEADLVSAITLTYVEEAIGIVRAAQAENIPVVIGFTVETDGKLPSGHTIQYAIETVDAATNNYAAYYMINCAHPTHFQNSIGGNKAWKQRIRSVRANASTKSHAELDEAEVLDDGNPEVLGHQYVELREELSNLNVLGGCCGTDHRHIAEICKQVIG